MSRLVSLPAGLQFRIMYWDAGAKKMEVIDPAVNSRAEAIRIAEGLVNKHSNHNIEILTLVDLLVVHEGQEMYQDMKEHLA